MSEITDILAQLQALDANLADNCPLNEMTDKCRDFVAQTLSGIKRIHELVSEHLRRDTLIDDLYYDVGSKLNTTFDLDELLGVIIDSLEKLIGFDAAGIFLVNEETGQIEADFIRGYHFDYARQVQQKVGEGILGWVIENHQAVNLGDVAQDRRYINARPETKSEAAVPLISEGRVMGCINIESNELNAFTDEDLALLETFSTQASLAIERARLQLLILEKKILEEEVSLARKIQLSLLPEEPPEYPDYQLGGMNIPSRAVGGDYYDFIPLPDGGLGLAIADVSGKGLPAALTMSGFRAALRAEVRHALPPSKLMHKVNHFVYESTEIGDFVTAFFAVLQGKILTFCNAGHNPPILMNREGEYRLLSEGGMILGFDEDQQFDQVAVELSSGDTLLLYTDGVTEAMNADSLEFGIEGLLEILRETRAMEVNQRIRRIYRKLLDYSGKFLRIDDLTLMIVSRL